MEPAAMLARLAADGAALRDAATDVAKPVPTCPGWTVADAVEHTAVVYAHKATVVEGGLDHPPTGWPPEFAFDNVVDFYDEQLHRVIEALRTRDPSTAVWTWYEPDQTVGFWVRRMMQETVIHRADVESATGPMTPVADAVALDGIDELLVCFLAFDSWHYAQAPGAGERVGVRAGDAAWTVELAPQAATVTDGVADDVDAVVEGGPSDVLLALWNRKPYDAVKTSGDGGALATLRAALAATTV